MNISNWSGKRKVWALLGALLAIVGIVVTIFLVKQQQDNRSRAEKATVLKLSSHSQEVSPGDTAEFDVVVDPGVNQVNFVKFTVKYDPDVFSPGEDSGFTLDPASQLQIIEGPSEGEGELSVTLNVGSNPTQVIRTMTKIGTLKLQVKDGAPSGSTQVSFDENEGKTNVSSIGDNFTENVLSSTVPATITIGGGVCKPNIGICSWDSAEGATSYHYLVTEVSDSEDPTGIPPVKEGDTNETSVEFPSIPGKTYKCEIVANNECGSAEPNDAQSTCPAPSVTPSPSPSASPSPSPSPTETPTPTPTASPTPSPTVSPTPSPTPEITLVVTQPPQVVVTTIPQGGVVVATPSPTLPPTGNPLVFGGIFGGFLFVLGGLALLLL